MSQDFWASSGFRLLGRVDGGLRATRPWLARFVDGPELTRRRTQGRASGNCTQ
jgi:hypothetical protein